jgi:hypothetical protein
MPKTSTARSAQGCRSSTLQAASPILELPLPHCMLPSYSHLCREPHVPLIVAWYWYHRYLRFPRLPCHQLRGLRFVKPCQWSVIPSPFGATRQAFSGLVPCPSRRGQVSGSSSLNLGKLLEYILYKFSCQESILFLLFLRL